VTTDFATLFRALASTDFILIGGLAAVHGAACATYDVDVLYARTPENIERLVEALAPLQPYLRSFRASDASG